MRWHVVKLARLASISLALMSPAAAASPVGMRCAPVLRRFVAVSFQLIFFCPDCTSLQTEAARLLRAKYCVRQSGVHCQPGHVQFDGSDFVLLDPTSRLSTNALGVQPNTQSAGPQILGRQRRNTNAGQGLESVEVFCTGDVPLSVGPNRVDLSTLVRLTLGKLKLVYSAGHLQEARGTKSSP